MELKLVNNGFNMYLYSEEVGKTQNYGTKTTEPWIYIYLYSQEDV
jgi:hypothetical protein